MKVNTVLEAILVWIKKQNILVVINTGLYLYNLKEFGIKPLLSTSSWK